MLPSGAGSARGRVRHTGRVERRPPATLVVLRQLQVKALTMHPDGDVPDAGLGVHPGAERPECVARSYDGMEQMAKPTAARTSWPRWSSTRYSMT